MARPETPIDPRTGPEAAFAVKLRQLPGRAGVPYRELAQHVHYSAGALSEAASGRRLPTWEITAAFVKGCEGDEQQWRARWEAAAAEIGAEPSTATTPKGAGNAVATPSDSADLRQPLPSDDVPPLSSITSAQDFHLALRAMRSRAGEPSLRQLSILARKNGGHMLPRSTLADALARTGRLPSLEIVEAFLSACDVPAAEVDDVKSAWARVAYLQQRDSMPGWQGTCPYLGLAAFTEDHAEVFYGRQGVTAQLLKELKDRVRGGLGMQVVTGPSGAGKSSLLRAGLLPALAKGGLGFGSQDWPRLVITPGSAPLDQLAVPLAQLAGVNSAEVRASLADHPDRAHLNARQALVACGAQQPESASRALPARLVVIVDQFEELFTVVRDEAERQAFITSLCAMAGVGCGTTELPPAIVVLGLRADFIGRCTAYPPLAEATRSKSVFVLGPMTEAELQLAITGPAKAAGLSLETGLVDDVLAELRSTGTAGGFDPGALPLLSQAMLLTWDNREGTTLTRHAYVASGGLRNSIQTSAEEVYDSLTPEQQEAAQRLFRSMVTFTDQGQPTRCTIQLSDLKLDSSIADDRRAALEEFTNKRLITVSKNTAEIVHEVLLHTWKRLEDWIDQDREWLRLSRELESAASVWEENERDPAFLYRGSRLDTAEENAKKADSTILPSVQSFLDASRSHERRRTRMRSALRTSVGLLAVAAISAGVSIHQQDRSRYVTDSEQMAIQAQLLAAVHPDRSIERAMEAFHRVDTPITHSALLSAQSQYFAGQLVGHTGTINKVVFSPDGRLLATASADDTTRLWDVTNHQQIAVLSSPGEGEVNEVQFSPDGRFLVTVSEKGTAQLWDVASHQLIVTFLDNSDTAFSVATFSPDGRFLATVSAKGTAQLWDVTSHRSIAKLGTSSLIKKIAFRPDGHILATADADYTVQLWNVTDPPHPTLLGTHLPSTIPDGTTSGGQPLGPPVRSINSPNTAKPPKAQNDKSFLVAFSPDGTTLATADGDGTVHLWNVDNLYNLNSGITLNGHPNRSKIIKAVAFSPDGTTLVTVDGDGNAQLWDVATHQSVGTLIGYKGVIQSVAFGPDGHTVATAGDDDIARLWDMDDRILSSPAINPNIYNMEFSPDGNILALVGGKDTLELWDTVKRKPITKPDQTSYPVAFSEDGRLLATVDTNGSAQLWSIASRDKNIISTLTDPFKINKVVFSPRANIIATIGADDIVRLWNVTDSFHPTRLGELSTDYTSHAVAFSQDGRFLATAGTDGSAQLWNIGDIASRYRIATLTEPKKGFISKVVFSPKGDRLASVNGTGTVRWWETATGQPTATPPISPQSFPDPEESTYPLALSPNGRILATASRVESDTTIRLWNMEDEGKPIATLTGHTGLINIATFSRDSSFLATTSEDGTVRLWDLDTDRVMDRLRRISRTTARE